MTADIHETVRLHYAEAARDVLKGTSCCSDENSYGSQLYSALEREELPDAAVLASLGCGNPMMVADLHEGERVLDLGSGGGIDVLLSARRVGPTGRAFGLDMTDEMLTLARQNAATAGATNVEFLKGHIEEIPLPADSIDVVISNCVVNLAADKPSVFREIARVLRPGGRIGIADIVADDSLTPEKRAELGSYAGCIAGALSFSEYRAGLAAAGMTDVAITVSHEVGGGMFSALVKASKPAAGGASDAAAVAGAASAVAGAAGASGAGASGAGASGAEAAPVPAGVTATPASQADCCGAGSCCGGAVE
jgi:SAM-dependent methyltransferase